MSLRNRIAAWGALVTRYRQVWGHFWQQRDTLTPPALTTEEAEFLPAALSLQAQPVSPAGRWVARILMLLVLALVAWSVIGRTDIVVNAQGKVIPNGRTKTVGALEVARVQALHVEDGQVVRAGELLIELDPRLSDTEQDKAQGEFQAATLQRERAAALLAALDSGQPPNLSTLPTLPTLPTLAELDPDRLQMTRQHLQDQWRDYTARMARLDGEIRRYGQELPLVAQRARDYAELAQTRDVSRHAWMEKEQARLDLEGQIADLHRQKTALTAELRKSAQDTRTDASRQAAAAQQEVRKGRVRGDLLRLTAPVDGTVQQLAVHTVGGVVSPAQPLMQIVPKQTRVEMEAFIENRDVGFVREGQTARVKIDAFEYTKYGTLEATVAHVSRDAIPDEKRGPIYAVKLALRQPVLQVEGEAVPITAGMSGSVEIKTGSRRLIEYVLSPLVQHVRESLHER
ncbi:HlyD family type I secretion periplasmic adaptor subunit [Sphaerotilus sp.]|uniref:HlyD family type I secretion periplasmic adaptor subunit n=1 Tax=Sphaerotilus sp. TaxID=2093942 RepID=UPI00286E499E|nr:HlyD family type I secretion periplasmic adaptor subunit [Sphaerotilus sp.]